MVNTGEGNDRVRLGSTLQIEGIAGPKRAGIAIEHPGKANQPTTLPLELSPEIQFAALS